MIKNLKNFNFSRFIQNAASLILLSCFMAACSGNQLNFNSPEEKKSDDQVVLDEKGLPSIEQLMKVGPLGEKSLGKANAPVTIIEYVSLTCPHCKAFHLKTFPILKRDYINKGKVLYIARMFPIGRSAGNASIVAHCGSKDRYFKLIDLFLSNQGKWVSQEVRLDAIYSVAKKSGLPRSEFDQCMQDKTLIENLNKIKNRGRQLGVTGTPTFFINGKKIRKPLTIEELRAIITPHLS